MDRAILDKHEYALRILLHAEGMCRERSKNSNYEKKLLNSIKETIKFLDSTIEEEKQ